MTERTQRRSRPRRLRRWLMWAGVCTLVALLALAGAAAAYRHHNLHFDEGELDATWAAGYLEKQAHTASGTTLNYVEGPDNGPALLLVHGQQMSWDDYHAVLPELAKGFHVFAVDCHGHGKSSHDPAAYTARRGAQDFVWFLREVVREPAIVSGHSSGGIIAALVAAEAPDDVRGLVLEDPPLFSVTPQEMREGAGTFVWKDSFTTIHDFLGQDALGDYPTYYMEHAYMAHLFGGLQPTLAKWTRERRLAHPGERLKLDWVPPQLLRGFRSIDSYDLAFGEAFHSGTWMEGVDQEATLGGIKAPTVYLKAVTKYGNDGTLFAANTEEDAARVMAALNPGARRVDVDCGHDIHAEKPEVFVEAVRSLSH